MGFENNNSIDSDIPQWQILQPGEIDAINASNAVAREEAWNNTSTFDKFKHYGGEALDALSYLPPQITGIIGGFSGALSGGKTIWNAVKQAKSSAGADVVDTLGRQFKTSTIGTNPNSKPSYMMADAPRRGEDGVVSIDNAWTQWPKQIQDRNILGKTTGNYSLRNPEIDTAGFGNISEGVSDIAHTARDVSLNPTGKMNIYRSIPTNSKTSNIYKDDFVTNSKAYADEWGRYRFGDGKFQTLNSRVDAKDVLIDNYIQGQSVTGMNLTYSPVARSFDNPGASYKKMLGSNPTREEVRNYRMITKLTNEIERKSRAAAYKLRNSDAWYSSEGFLNPNSHRVRPGYEMTVQSKPVLKGK